MNLTTTFTAEALATEWTAVATYDDGDLVAYRSNHPKGILRIIDADSGCDILECLGNPFTASIEDAKAKADKIMGVAA